MPLHRIFIDLKKKQAQRRAAIETAPTTLNIREKFWLARTLRRLGAIRQIRWYKFLIRFNLSLGRSNSALVSRRNLKFSTLLVLVRK